MVSVNVVRNGKWKGACGIITALCIVRFVGSDSIDIKEYKLMQDDSVWNITQGSFPVRSILDCSRRCSKESNICGFNYVTLTSPNTVTTKRCQCILSSDLASQGGNNTVGGSKCYIRTRCIALYEEIVSGSTTSPTSTTSITRTSLPATTTRPSLPSTAVSTTATTSTTTTARATTTTARATTTTAKATTTTAKATTIGIAAATTTTTKVHSSATPRPSTTKTPSPTTTSMTTASDPCSSVVNALVCLESSTYLFRGDRVLIYSSFETLTDGPRGMERISSVFPEVTYPVMGSYDVEDFLYIANGDAIWKYNTADLAFISAESTASMFGRNSLGSSTYDAILHSGTQTFIFQGTDLYIVEKGEISRTTSIDNNGGKNPYKSKNFSERPLHIVAGCAVDTDRHVFISDNSVYLFTFSSKQWTVLGDLACY